MRTIADTRWGKKRVSDKEGLTITTRSLGTNVLDLGLKVTGGAMMYGLGMLGGEIIEQIPYINEAAYGAVKSLSDIDVRGNLGGLVGMITGLAGFVKSGVKLDEETMTPKDINLVPLYLNFSKNKVTLSLIT